MNEVGVTTKIETEPETYTAEAEVRVTYRDGAQVLEVWRGISKRHALGIAREHY